MRFFIFVLLAILSPFNCSLVLADEGLLKTHCSKCHSGTKPKGNFSLSTLGQATTKKNLELWESSLDYVRAEEMPPAKQSQLSKNERKKLVAYFEQKISAYNSTVSKSLRTPVRRMNNREFENSVRDVLLIEDIGTHQPTANLIGDSLHEGFDTHGETLGFSKFHLEQYLEAVRKIVDATVTSDERPQPTRVTIPPTKIFSEHTSQNTRRPERKGKPECFDFLDPRQHAYFAEFKTVPYTGWYRIRIRCTGKDRGVYSADDTGIYHADPIRMNVELGDRVHRYDLPDEKEMEIDLREWLAAGTRLRLHHPTDGLRMRGNGNFKFQNAITGEFLKENDRKLYDLVVSRIKPNKSGRIRKPSDWHHWVDYWKGPRPRVLGAVVEGPFYDSWPPKRQVALIGNNPQASNAKAILKPIAERAWRRTIQPGDLDKIVSLVQAKAETLSDIEALKEGIVAILVSPQFLLLNQPELSSEERFASKLSYFLRSTIPDADLQKAIQNGQLDTFDGVLKEVKKRITNGEAKSFERAFPFAWLKLNDINFMAPDPDRYRHYHRKSVSEDMTEEVVQFFAHAIDKNIPLPEFLSANYSFVNADLAKIYGIEDFPQDSQFHKHTFTDGRRGGLLGMGAFLTVTADSLGTSPIHRAIYVMETFLGIHPSPPPADVKIEEPDVRSAKTIREVLEAHRSDESCAACHRSIDPFGYAFENFDPTGAWRETYESPMAETNPRKNNRSKRVPGIPIDPSATFVSGTGYEDIVGFRTLMQTEANRDRFVRCFVKKLLLYANGEEPKNATEIEKIIEVSAKHDYRILETIAAVIDSPLFREEATEESSH